MENFKIISAILSAIILTIAFFPYLRDMFRGRTKPHIYTWLLWSITQTTAVVGLWQGKGGIGAIGLTIGVFFVFFILILSLKYGTKDITKSDTFVLALAILAIFVWWQLKNLTLAVFMVSLIDALSYIPSYRKSWNNPWSETLFSWICFFVGDVFAVFALDSYNLLTLTYLVTIIVCNFVFIMLCVLRKRKIAAPIPV
jgi:hypothetical protein